MTLQTQLKTLSSERLLNFTKVLFEKEKKLSDSILLYLGEIKCRRLYAELGYESLYQMLIKHFHLSESSAYNRIKSLRLTEAVPAAREALEQGAVNLSTLTLAQVFIQSQEKYSGQKMNPQEKTTLIERICHKSQAQVKQELAALNPALSARPQEQVKALPENRRKLEFSISDELWEQLQEIKSLMSHQNPNPTLEELLQGMAGFSLLGLKKKKASLKETLSEKQKSLAPSAKEVLGQGSAKTRTPQTEQPQTTPAAKLCVTTKRPALVAAFVKNQKLLRSSRPQSRYIQHSTKRQIWRRAQGRCEFHSSQGQRCTSRFQLEFDHRKAFAKGGGSDASNLQLLCRNHNQAKMEKEFGRQR